MSRALTESVVGLRRTSDIAGLPRKRPYLPMQKLESERSSLIGRKLISET